MNAPRDVSFEEALLPMLVEPAALLVALRHVAKAHGMAEVARRSP